MYIAGDPYSLHVAQIKFAEGDDLNFLVYRFYDAKPDSGFQGTNYVTEDGITSKR